MDCKNCKSKLNQKNNYCCDCGAKIIRERITIKSLLFDLLVAFGWDSSFFVTLRHLFCKPQIVFKEYVNGTRKKYANPFTFFALSLAISLFVLLYIRSNLINCPLYQISIKLMKMKVYHYLIIVTKEILLKL